MDKITSGRIKLIIILIVTIIVTIMIIKMLVNPRPITEIKHNTVYICGIETDYPEKNQSRYYVELKKGNKCVLMYDDTRRKEENYDEDGDRSHPRIWIYYGVYEEKSGSYLIKIKEAAMVGFENTASVKKRIINGFGSKIYTNEKSIKCRVIYKMKRGRYVLGTQNKSEISYNKDVPYYMLYNKSDIKKLPSSPEEFRKQFKMDKKAEQERLAEQNR
ncbi:hypothetical protein [Mogibacterium pumilum]|uniref:Uncharacterized protein n=1 Tax=Mogibacterium pumilum TaxID=86332 RepID=A0A223AQY0_9FIRM|nr:hypothetical protein [Mogibacterium pumilum]ASS37378.1 hypothetical protein AXF17_02120 [Mogibacterium pumilum]